MQEITSARSGMFFKESGSLFEVLSYEHTKKGRGNATIKLKVKNLQTGAITIKGYITGKRLDDIELDSVESIFKYRSNTDYVFEDEEGEEIEVPRERLGEQGKFLKKQMPVRILIYEDEPLSVQLPIKYEYIVKEAPPDARGNSTNASTKEVVLETGTKVKTPMFIKEGDSVIIDTRDGSYIGRA